MTGTENELVSNKTLTENYVKKFNTFLEKHSSHLIDILDNREVNLELHGTTDQGQGIETDSLISTAEHQRQKKGYQPFVSTYALTNNVWDIRTDPVQIVWGPFLETYSFEELLCFPGPTGGNPDVQKIMLVLVTLTNQLKEMTAFGWKHFVFQFVLYGDGFDADQASYLSSSPPQSTSVTEGEGHVALSSCLPLLYDLKDFVENVSNLLLHSCQQLEAMFKDSLPHVVAVAGVNFHTLFQELGNLLALIIIIDEIISGQPLLIEHWTKYKRMITSVRADSANFDVDSESLLQVEAELEELDKSILGGRVFKNLIQFIVTHFKGSRKNVTLLDKFLTYFAAEEVTLEQNSLNGADELRPIAFTGLYILVSSLLTFDARKTFRNRIWPFIRKIPAIPIGGNLIWTPDAFLSSLQIGSQINFVDMKLLEGQAQARHIFLENKITTIQTTIGKIHLDVHYWAIELQEHMNRRDISQLRREDLAKRSAVLLDGVKLAQKLNINFRIIMNLHATLGRPVTLQLVSYLMQHLELLKIIQCNFYRFNVQICHTVLFILQTALHIGLSHVQDVKNSILSNLNKSNRTDLELRTEGLTIISILENVLKGPPSAKRLLAAQVAFDWSKSRCFLDSEEKRPIIKAVLDRIHNMVNLLDDIETLCNGSSAYWHRQLFSNYFSSLYNNEHESSKFPIVELLLDDCLQLLDKHSPHSQGNVQKAFVREIESYFKASIIDKLCTDLENNLRLQTHSHLQIEKECNDSSPFRIGIKDFEAFLQLPSLVLGDHKINPRFIAEYHLSKNFYNLASVALHDWQSYGTMRVLGRDKYNLQISEDHLPGHALEQGQDILAIVRNLKKFVSDFSYNLNNQVFIQVESPNKHLETVGIRHLANSIRTHGLGMCNSTVNCAYQFLRTKIHSFSQFLFDEQIKSKLTRDLRAFKVARQNQETTTGAISSTYSYPYDKAHKFQKGIRKLGLTPSNLSPLDQFRILITQIGNTLGFVRLVVSGGRHYLAQASRFLPEMDSNTGQLDSILPLTTTTENGKGGALEEELRSAAINLEAVFRDVTQQQSPDISYFRLLVSAFHAACLLPSNAHMKNFFVIIPALTLSYVDHMRSCKEKLAKNSKHSLLFTDDGFPMGLAYMLKVLYQDADFDSLQWFSGVTHKLVEERKRALQIIRESKSDEKLQQANTLTAKRVQDYLHEFHLLRYNLRSARIFFQTSLESKSE